MVMKFIQHFDININHFDYFNLTAKDWAVILLKIYYFVNSKIKYSK